MSESDSDSPAPTADNSVTTGVFGHGHGHGHGTGDGTEYDYEDVHPPGRRTIPHICNLPPSGPIAIASTPTLSNPCRS